MTRLPYTLQPIRYDGRRLHLVTVWTADGIDAARALVAAAYRAQNIELKEISWMKTGKHF